MTLRVSIALYMKAARFSRLNCLYDGQIKKK